VHVTAVDCSPVQVATARKRWGHLPNLAVQQADALAYLTASGTAVWDAVYSVFGAAWFCAPERLLPAVRSALRSGGLFAFSHADAQPEGVGPLTSWPEIVRWDYRPHTWVATLQCYGFYDVVTRELPATPGFPHCPTMLVTAYA
jgi:SAM-dependent methyltransferase